MGIDRVMRPIAVGHHRGQDGKRRPRWDDSVRMASIYPRRRDFHTMRPTLIADRLHLKT